MTYQSRSFGLVVLLFFVSLSFPSKATEHKPTNSIASYAKYVHIPGAKSVGADTCTSCHSVVAQNYSHAFHAQQGVECEDCHGAGSLHVEGGGDVTKIIALGHRSAEEANGVCLSCHAQEERVRHWIGASHAVNHVRCMDCHQVHHTALREAKNSKLSFDEQTRGALAAALVSPETNVIVRPMWETNEACLKCHPTQVAQLSMPYHHPLREGKMSCEDCHDPHGGANGRNLKASNVNQLCLSCHAQYRGPFAYQHPPVTENCVLCHTAHGSPNYGLLAVSEPALCLQCHAGHHDGASLPLPDRCTTCHLSIHGTDVPTPSGGSRFLDKGPSEPQLVASAHAATGLGAQAGSAVRSSLSASSNSPSPANLSATYVPALMASHAPTLGTLGVGGTLGMMAPAAAAPLGGGMGQGAGGTPGGMEEGAAGTSALSFTFGQYRFLDGTGYLGRVGQYDSLQQSQGVDFTQAYVSPSHKLTMVSQAAVLTGEDYSERAQLTAGEWLQAGLFIRSFVQQQDNTPFYAFPVLDVPPASAPPPLPNCQPSADCTSILIPSSQVFGVQRRLGNAYVRVKVPKIPVYLFVDGGWQARVGQTQLAYLDENSFVSIPGFTQTCGAQCHFQSQLQPVNYTTRNIGGGIEVKLGKFQATYEHTFWSFNDRLLYPVGTYTGTFFPEADSSGISSVNPPSSATPPRSGPTPGDVAAGNYIINPPSSNQASTDRVGLNWTASPNLIFNGNVSYTRLSDLYTNYSQNWFNTDETVNWRAIDPLLLTVDYHQHNVINDFTPYYSEFGNVSYHDFDVGVRGDYRLPKGFDIEPYYQRSGITRSNAFLWPQFYSVDNTDLMTVVPSSSSNTTGVALRYHDHNYWSVRAGYEWTGTNAPGYLVVPQSNNRVFADVWLTPARWLVFANDLNINVQNAFPAVPLPYTPGGTARQFASPGFNVDIAGLPPTFQRSVRFFTETATATLRFVPGWDLGLGYSYQQFNLKTYMAFQNDSGAGYILDEPLVPYKQITQAYWGDSSYLYRQRLGVNLRVTYNSSRSGMRPNVDPNNAAQFGNAYLISQGMFDPAGLFPSAMSNLQFAATQISEVIVPQWIGEGKAYYLLPRKFEAGFVFYYGSYRDYWNPNLNGVLRTMTAYVGKSW